MSLIGPGGIGKSRLAIEVARATRRTSSPTASTSCCSRACSSRGCCCRRSRYSLGIRDNGEAGLEERIAHALGGPARADRARQLRADRGCRAGARAAVHRRAAGDASSSRAAIVLRIRGERSTRSSRSPTPAGRRRRRASTAPRARRRVALFVDRAAGRQAGLRRSPRRTPRTSPTSAAGSRACRWRSSSPPRRCALLTPARHRRSASSRACRC